MKGNFSVKRIRKNQKMIHSLSKPNTMYVGRVYPAGECWNSTRFLVGRAIATVTSIKICKLVLQPAAGHTSPTHTVCVLLQVRSKSPLTERASILVIG
jgi:hypothetical protein